MNKILLVILGIFVIFITGFFAIGYFASKSSEKIAEFNENGLAALFNCKMKNENVLTCKYSIKFAKEYSEYESIIKQAKELKRPGFEDKKVWIILENEENWDKVKNMICQKLKGKDFNCQDLEKRIQRKLFEDFNIKGCQCNGIGIYLRQGIIFYEYEK